LREISITKSHRSNPPVAFFFFGVSFFRIAIFDMLDASFLKLIDGVLKLFQKLILEIPAHAAVVSARPDTTFDLRMSVAGR
jgi:hypothetical protein